MSDSNSTSSQTTRYDDNRVVLGQDAQQATNGGTISTANTTYALDNGAIDAAFKSTDKTVARAFDFGDSALTSNNKAITSSLNFAGDTVDGALSFGKTALADAFNSNAQTVDSAFSFAQTANDRASTSQRQAWAGASDALSGALQYGARTTATALDSLNQTENLVTAAYADAKGRGALTDKIMMLAIAGAAVVAWAAVRGR